MARKDSDLKLKESSCLKSSFPSFLCMTIRTQRLEITDQVITQ